MAKNSGFLPTNNHLTQQIKAKNENVGEVANPSLSSELSSDEVPHDSKKKKKSHCPNDVRRSTVRRSAGPPVAPNHCTSAWTEPHSPSVCSPKIRLSAPNPPAHPPQITVCGRSEDLERPEISLKVR
jgi:hypothetical protein